MGVGPGLYMYDVVVKRSRSLSHLLMGSCNVRFYKAAKNKWSVFVKAMSNLYLLFLKDTCSTAVPLVDGQTHIQNKHVTRVKQRLGRRNLCSQQPPCSVGLLAQSWIKMLASCTVNVWKKKFKNLKILLSKF